MSNEKTETVKVIIIRLSPDNSKWCWKHTEFVPTQLVNKLLNEYREAHPDL